MKVCQKNEYHIIINATVHQIEIVSRILSSTVQKTTFSKPGSSIVTIKALFVSHIIVFNTQCDWTEKDCIRILQFTTTCILVYIEMNYLEDKNEKFNPISRMLLIISILVCL